jgi:hypothetical protein
MNIQEFIESGEYKIRFGWLNKSTYGIIDREKEEIILNVVLLTTEVMVHEYLHWKTQSDDEKFIEKKTDQTVKRMTVQELHELFQLVIKHLE